MRIQKTNKTKQNKTGSNTCSGGAARWTANAKYLFCEGRQSCRYRVVHNVSNIIATGDRALFNGYIYSNDHVGEMNIYAMGRDAITNLQLYCSTNDICNIYWIPSESKRNVSELIDSFNYLECPSNTAISNITHLDRGVVKVGLNCFFIPLYVNGGYFESMAPSSIPTTDPSNYPSTDPSSLPTSLPTIEPSSNPSIDPSVYPSTLPTDTPTGEPSFIPTSDPSVYPSVFPSVIPTNFPTKVPSFTDNGFNDTVLFEIVIYSSSYNVTKFENNNLLEKDIIIAVKEASVSVRHEISDINEVDVDIDTMANFYGVNSIENGKSSSSYSSSSSYATLISMYVSMENIGKLERWVTDISFIMDAFESNLVSIWDIDNNNNNKTTFSISLFNVEFETYDETTTDLPTTTITTSEVEVETSKTNETTDNNGRLLDASTLNDWSYYTVLVITCCAVLITFAAFIDAKKFRHNESFKWGVMFMITAYLLDVVSGMWLVVLVLFQFCFLLFFFF